MRQIILIAFALCLLVQAEGQQLAFPGAEGYGRFAKGGRGGDVYHVTQLGDSGSGSLREGIETATGPRTIVFEVSGTIALKSILHFEGKALTIAGQTAPGDGITIRDYNIHLRDASDFIIRYIRLRLGDQNKKGDEAPDALTVDRCENFILDHLSVGWGVDGNCDTRGSKDYTIQWSIFSEALHDSIHPEGPHAMCASFRGPLGNGTIHHNLFASSRDRHPTIGGSVKDPQWLIDFRNNVIFNWSGAANVCDNQVNLVNNYFKPGPETDRKRQPVAMKASLPDKAKGWMGGNVFEGNEGWTKDNYSAMDMKTWLKPDSGYKYAGTVEDWSVDQPYDLGEDTPATQSASEAYEMVLEKSGVSRVRDAVDTRFIADLREGKGKLINSQEEVGGWPTLKGGEVPLDKDRDGMADAWEREHDLDPTDPGDLNEVGEGGYTRLEEYLNGLCEGSSL